MYVPRLCCRYRLHIGAGAIIGAAIVYISVPVLLLVPP
jgi:hypothetical protein